MLERYLQDHHAGAAAGLRLARSLADTVPSSQGSSMAVVAREIEEDARSLDLVMEEYGVRPSATRDAAARLGGVAARVRRLVARGRESGAAALLVELELLEMGITGKRLLWVALRSVEGVDDARLEELAERATRQQARVEIVRLHVAEALHSGAPPLSGGSRAG